MLATLKSRVLGPLAAALSSLFVAAIVFAQDQTGTTGGGGTTSTTTTTTTMWYSQWWVWAIGIGVFLIVIIALTNRGGTRST